jgi:hypothetical protein
MQALLLAALVTFNVQHPIELDNNQPIVGTVYTTIDCGPSATPGGADWTLIAFINSPNTQATVDLADGQYWCAAHSSLDDHGNNISQWSSVVHFMLPVPPPATMTPKSPVIVSVTFK